MPEGVNKNISLNQKATGMTSDFLPHQLIFLSYQFTMWLISCRKKININNNNNN